MVTLPNSRVYVVVPAFNEATALAGAVAPLLSAGYQVVVVDDGSVDHTGDEAARLPVHLLRHPINMGQGAALQTGMTYALSEGAEAVVHFDADGQHEPEAVASLLEPIRAGRADVVLGSRFLLTDSARDVPRAKRWMLRAVSSLSARLTGMRLTDTHNGLRAFAAESAARIRIYQNRMAHASEILGAIRRQGLAYEEVPVHVRYTDYSRRKGQSIFNAVNIAVDLCLRRIFQ